MSMEWSPAVGGVARPTASRWPSGRAGGGKLKRAGGEGFPHGGGRKEPVGAKAVPSLAVRDDMQDTWRDLSKGKPDPP
jgi:hypothetical protein